MISALMLMWQAAVPLGETVHLPIGYIRYCVETRDPACVKATITPRDLAFINKAIVEWMHPTDAIDPDHRWEAFRRDGNCEDHVATVRQALLAFGVDPKAMHFEAGQIRTNGVVADHIVLVVALNGKNWVLDVKTPDILYTPNDRPYPWTPTTRESAGVLWSIP